MNTERRKFIRNSSLITGGLVFIDPLKKLAGLTAGNAFTGTLQTVNIFHTNDLHNQLHPFTGGNRHGYGGLRNISGVLDAAKSKHILLDAGDFLDSKASPEDHSQMIQVMNQLGYHAATIGNRELARGQEYLAGLASEMKFRLVNCNYSFSNPALREQVLSSHIISWGQFKSV